LATPASTDNIELSFNSIRAKTQVEVDMKDRFKDIMDIEDVYGVIFLSFDGKLLYSEFASHLPENLKNIHWLLFIHALDGIRETQLVFEHRRFYIRKTGTGFIFVVVGEMALIEMVRLNCDILLPAFEKQAEKPKGFMRFFKR